MVIFETTYSIENIQTVANTLLQHFKHKIICFDGVMGAGKTTLISALLEAMGSNDKASSPTFSIVNSYATDKGNVHHFDFYRLKSVDEALDIGVEDYFYSDAWVFIEWASRIEPLIPNPNAKVLISFDDNLDKRHLKLITSP